MAEEPQQKQPGVINTEQAARLLMIGAERVRQLAKDGWIPKIDRDSYYLVDVVQGYLRYRNDAERRATKSGADARVREARAEEINLRVGVRAGQLMEHAEHVALIEELVGHVRAELGGLPARLTRDLPERRRIEKAVYELLQRLAARAQEMARVGGPSGQPVAAVNADNAGSMGG